MTTILRRRIKIVNVKGLHARASAKLAELAKRLPCSITVERDGEIADAKSIMDLLCLAAHQGSFVDVTASGETPDACLEAVSSLIADGFGELGDAPDAP